MLADLEFVSTAGRIADWHRRLADRDVSADDLDIRVLHQQLFADVYAWAGSYRVTELRLGDDVFARQSSVEPMMDRLEESARAVVADSDRTAEVLAAEFARLYTDYNHIHPFREGNGRTGTTMLHIVAVLCGRRLDLNAFSRERWYAASRDSMPFRRDGGPITGRFCRCLCGRSRSAALRRTNASVTEVLWVMWRLVPTSSANCSTWSGGSDVSCGGRPDEGSTRPVSPSPRPSCFAW